MRKGLGIICFLFLFISNVEADIIREETVELNRCVDGDTAVFNVKNEEVKVRFLAIDTPEYTTKKEVFGKEASEFVCGKLEKADEIVLQYEDNASTDKYGRTLAWVFTDGSLLQKDVVSKGLAEVAYLKSSYTHTEELKEAQKLAQDKKINIWSAKKAETKDEKEIDWLTLGTSGIAIILALLFCKSKSEKRRLVKKHVKKIQKSIK